MLTGTKLPSVPGAGVVVGALGDAALTFLAAPAPPAAGTVTSTRDVVARHRVPTGTALLAARPEQPLRTSLGMQTQQRQVRHQGTERASASRMHPRKANLEQSKLLFVHSYA